jgi:hypothetical protein
MGDELKRNFLGFVLLAAGVGLVLLGAHVQIGKLSDVGFGFTGMAALALQVTPRSPKEPADPDPRSGSPGGHPAEPASDR